eukprot:GFUD01024749.1.p1 GENE.GFUD01024749.1~~GFUD01024749.1.p1  ORF type:complete len:353 (-),score=50.13 GFUD01024749.1:67-1077(-)
MEALNSLTSDLFSLLQDSLTSDVTITCHDGQVPAHGLILSARSPVFSIMLNSDMLEKETGIIKIEDFKVSVVQAMLHYLYTAKIEDTFDDTFDDFKDLLMIGDKYQIPSLVEACSKKLLPTISRSTALELGTFAETYSAHSLVDKCAEFLSENLDVLNKNWKEDVKKSPLFLASILGCVKSAHFLEVSRFGSIGYDEGWGCSKNRVDAITFKVSRPSSLISIGLYGSRDIDTDTIPVKIEVKRNVSSSVLLSMSTSYKSSGKEDPIKIPLRVDLEAETLYTICVYISTDYTYNGLDGNREVNLLGGRLRVQFVDSPESTNLTDVQMGQIPTLGFKI